MLAIPNHLTGETFDSVPVHKRKLGELQILSQLHQPPHCAVHDLGLTSAIFLIFNGMIGTGLAYMSFHPRSPGVLIRERIGSSLLQVLS